MKKKITTVESSNIWPASPYFSLCSLLLDEIECCKSNPPQEYNVFYSACLNRIELKMKEETDKLNSWRKQREEKGRKPLQSVFTRDCVEQGIDIDAGGARYNWVECSFVGLANLADSLYVMQKEVYEEQNLTIAELSDILEKNFKGAEDIRTRFANKYPKYGQGKSEVDEIVRKLTEDLTALTQKFEMYPYDSPFIPGAFVWVMHERLGSECGATPDGRVAGFAFADGAGPAQGREKEWPSAAILSVTGWDHSAFIGGIAFNMKMNKTVLQTEEEKEKFKELIQRAEFQNV
jgi:formate C-acetyltransferase